MKNQSIAVPNVFLVLVLAIVFTSSASAQTFKTVKVKGGARMMQVTSGNSSVWALATNGNPYIYKGSQFVLANTISLTQIAVGGGDARKPDTVWGLDSAGRIYNAAKSDTSWVFNQMPGILSFIAVGPGYTYGGWYRYEVWGLNPSAQIYRFNYYLNNWEQIPGTLQQLSVGAGQVWGINGYGEVYRFDGASFSQVRAYWPLAQISVGPSGIWGLRLQDSVLLQYSDYDPYVRSIGWIPWYDTLPAMGLSVGGDGVWAIRPLSNNPFNTFFLSGAYPNFLQYVTGTSLTAISAGGAGVWGIDSSGQVYAFSTP